MMKNKMILSMALLMGAVTFTACSDSNNDNGGGDRHHDSSGG